MGSTAPGGTGAAGGGAPVSLPPEGRSAPDGEGLSTSGERREAAAVREEVEAVGEREWEWERLLRA